MEMSLWPYTAGAIVEYKAPFKKDVCVRYGILPSHLVMIINEVYPGPNYNYQCMMLTSKTDKYYGYRVYINSSKNKYVGYGTVRTANVFTIESNQLGSIVGFVPKHFVEKCRKAYAYEIGLTDEIPEYYRQDPVVMGWLTGGEPNVPNNPDAFIIEDRKDDPKARFDIKVATAKRPRSTSIMKNAVLQICPKASDTVDANIPSYTPGITIDSENGATVVAADLDGAVESDAKVDASVETEPVTEATEETPRNRVEHTIPDPEERPEPETPAKEPRKKKRYGLPMCQELKDEIESRVPQKITVSDDLKKAFDMMGHQRHYEAVMGRLSPTDLIKLGYAKTQHTAKKLLDYTIWKVYRQKDGMITNVLNKTLNLKFLGNAYYAAYRTMTLSDIHDIKMGVQTYESYLGSYGFKPEESYIGELRNANLLSNPVK